MDKKYISNISSIIMITFDHVKKMWNKINEYDDTDTNLTETLFFTELLYSGC